VPGIYADLRILELGAGAAGPVATRYFAEQGATVVRLESSKRPDFLRLLRLAPDDPHGLEGSPMFALLNAGKRSVALNLQEPEARALALELARWADVVLENFSPGVMDRFGLGAERLLAEKPELVVVSSCLFGQTGPQRSYPGFGGQGSAIAGFNALTGWPDREAIGPYATITDSLSPRYAAVLIAAALLARRRTGRGQHIDLSQIEVGVYNLSEMIVRCSANGEVVKRAGNRDACAAPHGIYPCLGEDTWIAISVSSDAEWGALVGAMDAPAWAADARFASTDARRANAEELDARIAAWTREFGAWHLMAGLQNAGVAAGVVQNLHEVLRDPQLAHRHHFVTLEHPVLGSLIHERSGFRLAEHPGRFACAAPLLGEHTEAVLGALGRSQAAVRDLVARGVAI
jgi:benzylsuccinate CoA-transferase BbsF subunit